LGQIFRCNDSMPYYRKCRRSLGDGYGEVINARWSGLENMHGQPLHRNQIAAARSAVNRLALETFLKFDRALDEVSKLEHAGFQVDPPAFEALTDLLDG